MTDTERRELTAAELDLVGGGYTLQDCLIRANFVLLESGGIPDALSMSESLGIDSFLGASDAEALFHRLAWPSD